MSIEDAVSVAVEAAVERALSAHLPKLAVPQREAAQMLGVSADAIGRMVADGSLLRVGGPQGPIGLASILALAGWPMTAAPLSAPLSAVPGQVAS